MTALLIALLSGCTADYTKPAVPPDPAYTDPGVDTTAASPAYALALRPATYTLPDNSRPDGVEIETEWVIEVVRGSGNSWDGTLPFSVGNPRGYPPAGVQVHVDGQRIEYADRGMRSWSGDKRKLHVRWPTQPKEVRVSWPDLGHSLLRRSFGAAGLSEADFVRWSATISGETRQGMLLPAPATAEWTLEIPESRPRFETWLTMDHTPLPADQSDGATAVLEVVSGGEAVEVGRQAVAGDSREFQRFEADLSRWKGQEVTVRLRSEPGASSDHDYLFWASPAIFGAPSGEVRRVVVIGIDTTRPDHFGFHGYHKPTSPELDAIAASSVVFDFAWTPAPRTRPSFRSATTGRTPLEAVGAKTIGEVFQEHGFATAGIVANVHLQPRFGFNAGFDQWMYDNGAKAEDQVDRTLAFMKANAERDTYVFMHLLDPHIFYSAPGAWRNRFVTTQSDLPDKINRWAVYKRMAEGTLKDTDKQHLEELYDGEIAYTSYQLGRFFHELDRLGGKSLVIVHSDHGEEFWEHGGFEHNHSLYTDTTKALLMVRPGHGFEGGKRIDTPVTLADIAPTLFDYAGFDRADWPELDGMSLRPLIEGKPASGFDGRELSIGHLRYGAEQWGVVHDRHKYILHTGTGAEQLFDLTTDPGEQRDLVPGGADLAPFRRALADAHDMPVCPGLRISVRAPARGVPIAVDLPEVPLGVEILDPERAADHPTNQAWGEAPSRLTSEIGRVEWEPGSTRFVWYPGSRPIDGQIFVFYDHEVSDPGLSVRPLDAETPLEARPAQGGVVFAGTGLNLAVQAGIVISPPPGEAERMALLKKLDQGGATGDDIEMLRTLGYIGGGDEDEHGHEPEELTPEGSDETSGSSRPRAVRDAVTAQACRW